MEDGRHPDGLADLSEAGAGIFISGFGSEKPCLGAGDGGASGLNDQNIVGDQFLDQADVALVMNDLGIRAADNSATPLILPLMILSLRGVYEPRNLPPSM